MIFYSRDGDSRPAHFIRQARPPEPVEGAGLSSFRSHVMTDTQSTPVPSRDFTVLDQNNASTRGRRRNPSLQTRPPCSTRSTRRGSNSSPCLRRLWRQRPDRGHRGQRRHETIALPTARSRSRAGLGQFRNRRQTQPSATPSKRWLMIFSTKPIAAGGTTTAPMATSSSTSRRGRSRSTTTSGHASDYSQHMF